MIQTESKNELAYKAKLLRLTNHIYTAEDLDTIFIRLHSQIMEIFDAERMTIYAVNSEKDELFSKFKIGDEIKEIRVKIDKKSISGYVAFRKTLVNIADAYDEEELKRIDPELSFNKSYDIKSGFRTRQVLASAIIFQGEMLGVVQLINKKTGERFDSFDMDSVKEVARSLGIAFRNQAFLQKKILKKFGALVKKNLLTEEDLNIVIDKSRVDKKDIILILRQESGIHKRDILDSLSNFYYCPFMDYDPRIAIDKTLLLGINPDHLFDNLWIPLRKNNGKIEILIDDPGNVSKINEIKKALGSSDLHIMGALPEDILEYLHWIRNRRSINTSNLTFSSSPK